jgi:glucose dehydrogenase
LAGLLGSGTCSKRIIAGTLDARLIARRRTGKPCHDFGDGTVT